MAGKTANYSWDFVDSGADPVSGPDNFQHVQQIDATVKQISGNVVSQRVGTVSIPNPSPTDVTTTHVTLSPPLTGDAISVQATAHSSVPGVVVEVCTDNETLEGFDITTKRTSNTAYTCHWVAYGYETS